MKIQDARDVPPVVGRKSSEDERKKDYERNRALFRIRKTVSKSAHLGTEHVGIKKYDRTSRERNLALSLKAIYRLLKMQQSR